MLKKKNSNKYILWFAEVDKDDVAQVGGKNASLGEMYLNLKKAGVKVPNGFAVTAAGYSYFINHNNLEKKIFTQLKGLNTKNVTDLAKRGKKIRSEIGRSKLPTDLEQEIISSYRRLVGKSNGQKPVSVAVRSSATAEDLPDASFAGQQETYLNISGETQILEAVKKAFASLFTDRAISYREDKGFRHSQVALSVGVQHMVRSDLGASGVMFTLDTESGFRDVVLINSIYGLGENIVQGRVAPDEFLVFKPTLARGFAVVLSKNLGTKRRKMIYDKPYGTRNVAVSENVRLGFSISDSEAIKLAEWGVLIEKHFKRPMDIEWAKDGQTQELFIVQARPETVHALKKTHILEEYVLKKKNPKVLVTGTAVGRKIGCGRARLIMDLKNIGQFQPGEVLVTDMTDPDWEPIMKKAAAIVTDSGGRTAHAAIVSRELGIPAIVGSELSTKLIKTGDKITIDCSQGEKGLVYEGLAAYFVKKTNLQKIPKLKCQVMMNIGEPTRAFQSAQIPNDGVGLARLEFIINEYIKVHPLALLNLAKLKNQKLKRIIKKIMRQSGYTEPRQFFINRLAEGIARIAAAFYPKEVIVRMSDFRSNEYRHLLGGSEFEPEERNPMLGWRGASRYYDERFRPAFDMECAAFKKVREEIGLRNVKIMVPFVRTLTEAHKVQQVMKSNGLFRRRKGLEVYMMVEIPSNIVLAHEFAALFDGFSIGSNDLTQLTLGVDRDSELVAHVYDERNEAVKTLIRYVISVAKQTGTKIGICGQAPSDFPDFAEFLLGEGIDSISLNPDTLLTTRVALARVKIHPKTKN